jgi:hypothetical protein
MVDEDVWDHGGAAGTGPGPSETVLQDPRPAIKRGIRIVIKGMPCAPNHHVCRHYQTFLNRNWSASGQNLSNLPCAAVVATNHKATRAATNTSSSPERSLSEASD